MIISVIVHWTLTLFWLAKRVQWIFEISARDVITADYTIIMSRTLKVTDNHFKLACFVLLTVSEEAKTWQQTEPPCCSLNARARISVLCISTGDTPITCDMCMGNRTYHGDTHITVTALKTINIRSKVPVRFFNCRYIMAVSIST